MGVVGSGAAKAAGGYNWGYGGFLKRINIRASAGVVLAATLLGFFPAGPTESRQVLLVFGDSLTSGFGLEAEWSFPAQLEAALGKAGHQVKVLNAGVAGDTTTGGRARLAWSLARKPDAVIVELGANDGLRGIDPSLTAANLDAILDELKRRGIPALLTGMYAPPNLGKEYSAEFNAIFPRLANEHSVAFYPFFLDGVAAQPALNQRDGTHPNASGVAVIVKRILPYVVGVLP